MPNDIFKFNTQTNPPKCDMVGASLLCFTKPSIELFNETAKKIAKELANPTILKEEKKWNEHTRKNEYVWEVKKIDKANKISQIRKFYDEVCMWESKIKDEKTFSEILPFIKMLNAKAAYARGREHVDDKFVAFISTCLSQIKECNQEGIKAYKNFRTFFEAFYGFYKAERPKD
jgi:CRISPR type III-A-associated protein Csm2